MTPITTDILSLGTMAAQAAIIVVAGVLIFSHAHIRDHWLGQKILAHAMLVSFLIALASTFGSLFYSDIAGFEPCTLCWYERIVMYPQVILLGLALWRKEKMIAPYVLVLAVIGAAISGYQYLLQYGLVPSLPCSAAGAGCAKIFVISYGYITIPLMAFTGFLLTALLMGIVSLDRRA